MGAKLRGSGLTADGSVASDSAASMRSQCWSASTAAILTLSKEEEMEARKLEAQLRRIDSLKRRRASGLFLTKLEESEIRRKFEIDYAPVMIKVRDGAVRWTLDTEPLSRDEEKQVWSAEEYSPGLPHFDAMEADELLVGDPHDHHDVAGHKSRAEVSVSNMAAARSNKLRAQKGTRAERDRAVGVVERAVRKVKMNRERVALRKGLGVERARARKFKDQEENVNASTVADKEMHLLDAAREGSVDRFRFLLAGFKNIDHIEFGRTLLVTAAAAGNSHVVREFAENENNVQDMYGDTALMMAAAAGNTKVVRDLVREGADSTLKNRGGYTALDMAARAGHADVVRILFRYKPAFKIADEAMQSWMTAFQLAVSGGRPLHLLQLMDVITVLAQRNRWDIVRVWIKQGGNVHQLNGSGNTALMEVAKMHALTQVATMNALHIMRLLLQRGANVNQVNTHGNNALMEALRCARSTSESLSMNIVRLLVEQGTNLNQQNKDGHTALMEAAKMNALDIMRLFLERGANVNQVNTCGNTALMEALRCDRWTSLRMEESLRKRTLEVTRLLVEQGANVNQQNKDGNTALMMSAGWGSPLNSRRYSLVFDDSTGMLQRGQLPMMSVEAMRVNTCIVRFLVEQGANVNVENVSGMNALQMAETRGRTEAADVLLEAALLLTLHVGEPSPIGLVNATATDINGNELASVKVRVSFQNKTRDPNDNAWRIIRQAILQELGETRLLCFMLPDGRVLGKR